MKVTYIGTSDPTDNGIIEAFGRSFEKNIPVEIDAADVHPKLRTNPTFVVEDSASAASEADDKDDDKGEVDPEIADLRAQLDAKGIAYRSNAGVKKLTDLLAAASEADEA